MTISIIIASLLSGLLGAMGIGGGTILIIFLTNFLSIEQKTAQGINLIFFIVTGVIAIISNAKNKLINYKLLIGFLLAALPGTIIGLILLPSIPSDLLRKIFGFILILTGVKILFKKEKK